MAHAVIEDYEPDDKGLGVVVGRFMQPPPPPVEEDDSPDETVEESA